MNLIISPPNCKVKWPTSVGLCLLLIEVRACNAKQQLYISTCKDPMASLDIAEISNLPEQHGGVLQPSQGGSPTGTSILQALPEVQSREEPATQ